MPKTYNISLSIRDVGKQKGNLFVVSHADLPEGDRSTLALNYGTLLPLLDFIKVRPAELERIRSEIWIRSETMVRDVQVGPSEFGDVQWGLYFQLLHECSKSFALGAAARRAREAKLKYASSEN
jgi:hypothetical protein